MPLLKKLSFLGGSKYFLAHNSKSKSNIKKHYRVDPPLFGLKISNKVLFCQEKSITACFWKKCRNCRNLQEFEWHPWGGRHQQRTWQFKQLLKRLPVPIPPKWSVARNCCPASCSFFNTHYMLIVYNVFAKILGR